MFSRRSFWRVFTLHPRMAAYTCSSTHAHGTGGTCVRSTARGTLLISAPRCRLRRFPQADLLLAHQLSRARPRSSTASWEQILAKTLQNEPEWDAMANFDIDKAVAELIELTEEAVEFALQRKVGVIRTTRARQSSSMATGGRLTRSRRNARRRPHESLDAARRSRLWRPIYVGAIGTCRDFVWHFRTGRRSCDCFKGAKDWPPLGHVWPTFAPAATGWRVGQGCGDSAGCAGIEAQKRKRPPRQGPGGHSAGSRAT
jgi:hypothetical protein